MRFGIKDLLSGTLIVALVMLVVRSHHQIQVKRAAIVASEQQVRHTEDEIRITSGRLENADARFDFAKEVAGIHRDALEAFKRIESKYGTVESKPGWIGYRSLPTLKESTEQSRWAHRISVPDDYPVYLRTAVSTADAIASKDRANLDIQDWLRDAPLDDPAAHEIQLSPGIHDLVLVSYRGAVEVYPARIAIRLSDQLIFDAKTSDLSYQIGSSYSSTPQEQYHFRFDKPSTQGGKQTQFLVSLEIEQSDQVEQTQRKRFDFWVWLSSTPMQGSFREFLTVGEAYE